MTFLVVAVLLTNMVILLATWRMTVRNRRSLSAIQERECRANTVLHDAAVERGQVLTLVRENGETEEIA